MSSITFIDAHSHIQFPAYDLDRKEVISRANKTGVKMIAIGTDVASSQEAILAAEKHSGVILGATAGFHPGHLNDDWYYDKNESRTGVQEKFDINKLKRLASHSRVVAVGECGLDYYRLATSYTEHAACKERQKNAFLAQINLAHELNKPLVIHCRSAFPDLIENLVACRSLLLPAAGVIHFFSGTLDEARILMAMGFYIAFGGAITFPPKADQPKADTYENLVREIPLEKILLETDAPYLAPVPHRGKRNEPAYIIEIAKKIAQLKNISWEEVGAVTTLNAQSLFSL